MRDDGVVYRAYDTHDPDEAINKFVETIGREPTIILIRPGFPVTKDHPILLETKFCGQNIMMVSNEIDIAGYRNSFTNKDRARKKRKIIDAKMIWEISSKEQKMEESGLDDTPLSQPKGRKSAEEIAQEEWAKQQRPKIMTDEEYLRLMEKPGYVYLLSSDNGYHKIGRSIDVEYRRVQLEREIPVIIGIEYYFATMYYIGAEAFMHDRFSEYRTGRYEWFKLKKKQIDEFKLIEDYGLDGKLEKMILEQR